MIEPRRTYGRRACSADVVLQRKGDSGARALAQSIFHANYEHAWEERFMDADTADLCRVIRLILPPLLEISCGRIRSLVLRRRAEA